MPKSVSTGFLAASSEALDVDAEPATKVVPASAKAIEMGMMRRMVGGLPRWRHAAMPPGSTELG